MSIELKGRWYNRHGSVMDLEARPDGRLLGRYAPGVGLAEPGETFELIGFTAGDLVVFSVDFQRYGSLTSWVGHAAQEGGVERLETLWHMAVMVPKTEGERDGWRGLWSGADTFARSEPDRDERARGMPSHPVHPPNLGTV